jgi:hypothetical protein
LGISVTSSQATSSVSIMMKGTDVLDKVSNACPPYPQMPLMGAGSSGWTAGKYLLKFLGPMQTGSNSRSSRSSSTTMKKTTSAKFMRDFEICANALLDDSDCEDELIFYPIELFKGQEGHNSLTSSFSDAYYIPTAFNQRSVCTKSTIGSVSTMSNSAIMDDDTASLNSTDDDEMIFYAVNGQGAQEHHQVTQILPQSRKKEQQVLMAELVSRDLCQIERSCEGDSFTRDSTRKRTWNRSSSAGLLLSPTDTPKDYNITNASTHSQKRRGTTNKSKNERMAEAVSHDLSRGRQVAAQPLADRHVPSEANLDTVDSPGTIPESKVTICGLGATSSATTSVSSSSSINAMSLHSLWNRCPTAVLFSRKRQTRPRNSDTARLVSQDLCQSRLLLTNNEQAFNEEQTRSYTPTRNTTDHDVRNIISCSCDQRQTDIEQESIVPCIFFNPQQPPHDNEWTTGTFGHSWTSAPCELAPPPGKTRLSTAGIDEPALSPRVRSR